MTQKNVCGWSVHAGELVVGNRRASNSVWSHLRQEEGFGCVCGALETGHASREMATFVSVMAQA